jgi:hypothetical protein
LLVARRSLLVARCSLLVLLFLLLPFLTLLPVSSVLPLLLLLLITVRGSLPGPLLACMALPAAGKNKDTGWIENRTTQEKNHALFYSRPGLF